MRLALLSWALVVYAVYWATYVPVDR